MTLAYICNPEQVERLHAETTKNNGVYFFIRKKEEKNYNAYRKVDSGKGKFYFVKVGLPKQEFIDLIKSGKIDNYMK